MSATEQLPISVEQMGVYREVIDEARRRGLRFALGGGFAIAAHTGRWRNSKDLDLYTLPEEREQMIDVVHHAGLRDYYEKLPYDRAWIYRGYRDEVIVDVIWAMANHLAPVDAPWISDGPVIDSFGVPMRVIAAEELIWDKLFVLQRDRCDWPDVLNLIEATGPRLNWERLLRRAGENIGPLRGGLALYQWLSPDGARRLPEWLWERLQIPLITAPAAGGSRAALLDRRPWFGPDDPT